jgi:hypothetical protein
MRTDEGGLRLRHRDWLHRLPFSALTRERRRPRLKSLWFRTSRCTVWGGGHLGSPSLGSLRGCRANAHPITRCTRAAEFADQRSEAATLSLRHFQQVALSRGSCLTVGKHLGATRRGSVKRRKGTAVGLPLASVDMEVPLATVQAFERRGAWREIGTLNSWRCSGQIRAGDRARAISVGHYAFLYG